MEESAQVAPAAPETSAPAASAEPEMPESFNIFSEDPSPVEGPAQAQVQAEEPKRSKAFLDKVARDKAKRSQEIQAKKHQAEISKRDQQIQQMQSRRDLMQQNPDEYFRQQGVDPAQFYNKWTEQKINPKAGASIESQINRTQIELAKLRSEMEQKEKAHTEQIQSIEANQSVKKFVGDIEKFSEGNQEAYPLVRQNCTAKDVAQGIAKYYQKTGQQLSIEEAFKKIESGLAEHERKLYTDPKHVERFRRYNSQPVASNRVRGPQATLSSKWGEQPTRKDPEDMSFEEIREMYKGKLFT